jgi:hypothetical protein
MTEQFANSAASTLNGAITNVATSLAVTSAAAFPAGGSFRILVESEIMIVTAVAGAVFTVTRGAEGTTAAAHSSLVPVTAILTAGAIAQLKSDASIGPAGGSLGGTLPNPTVVQLDGAGGILPALPNHVDWGSTAGAKVPSEIDVTSTAATTAAQTIATIPIPSGYAGLIAVSIVGKSGSDVAGVVLTQLVLNTAGTVAASAVALGVNDYRNVGAAPAASTTLAPLLTPSSGNVLVQVTPWTATTTNWTVTWQYLQRS